MQAQALRATLYKATRNACVLRTVMRTGGETICLKSALTTLHGKSLLEMCRLVIRFEITSMPLVRVKKGCPWKLEPSYLNCVNLAQNSHTKISAHMKKAQGENRWKS